MIRSPKENKKSVGGGKNKRISKESKKIGDKGEEIVFNLEVKRLKKLGRDPAEVKWLARGGITPGWAISSVDDACEPFYIEVKASVGSGVSSLVLTRTEYQAATLHKQKYFIYLVTDVMKERPTIEIIRNPIQRIVVNDMTAIVDAWLIGLHPKGLAK